MEDAQYSGHRKEMEKHFTDDKARPDPKEYRSPSGKYLLRVTLYKNGGDYWDFSRGRVYSGNKVVGDVKRNYPSFPFAWVEEHQGHDYLLCGEDYQGQTVLELDTGERTDYFPTEGHKGSGFCWSDIHPSPNGKIIAVDGCYWGDTYDVVLYDFSDPMTMPYKIMDRWDCNREGWLGEGFERWDTNNKIILSRTVSIRKSDGKNFDDLDRDEWNSVKNEDFEDKKMFKEWEPFLRGD